MKSISFFQNYKEQENNMQLWFLIVFWRIELIRNFNIHTYAILIASRNDNVSFNIFEIIESSEILLLRQ